MDEIITVAEAAKMLEVTPDAVYKMIRRGELHDVGTGIRIRISRTEIDAYVKKRKEKK